ncbi:hypothetical protein GCM10023190_23840 [Enteractinococcus fodinae]|uniref:Lipoprotein n=1 Tax=Enteractinococcus fodinae TaxID=684663 RepID=A0ABU2B2L0_9MICC|nr:hypothetical protein [Enteractinococcus fodinae]MDR7347852.1 hypothetical protein [Enteractinococcus fodinae]
MTSSVSPLLRLSALAVVATLGLSACGSDDAAPETPSPDTGSSLEVPEAPEATDQETELAETLEADFEVTDAATLEDQWPDLTAMAAALAGTENPDLCQQAGAEQYGLLVEAQPPTVQANVDPEALLDEHASGETVTVFYANDAVSTAELHEVHQDTDTSCVEEYESAIDHNTSTSEVAGRSVEVHTWQVVASDQLTGRMIDIINDDILVRYAAAYPPQVIAEDLEDDAAETFNEAATERASEVFEAATAQ